MKSKKAYFVFLNILLALLAACGNTNEEEEAPVLPEPGTSYHYYLQGLDTSDPQEKLNFYNQGLEAITTKTDTSLVLLLDAKVYALRALGNKDSVSFWVDSLINAADYQGDLYFQGKGYYRKSHLFGKKDPEKHFRYAYMSRNMHLKDGDTAMAGRRSLDMANAQHSFGDYAGSQETAIEAINYLNHDKDPHYVSSAYNVLGLSFVGQGLHNEALKEYQMALKYAIYHRDSLSYLHNIALVYKDQEKYEEAFKIFEEITGSEEPHESSQIRFRDNYAYTRWLQDSAFNADILMLEALEQRKAIDDQMGLLSSYSHLAEYYKNKHPEKSLEYSKKLLALAQDLSSSPIEIEALNKLISLSSGNAKDQYVERYIYLNDSLKDASTKLKYQFAKIKFDEQQKEQQIELLEAENITQDLRAEQLKMGNIISSLAALLILIILITFFYYVKQRSKREKIRQIYLTENRISRRIHDELANDIYHVMSTLETVAPLPMIDKLEKIYQRTRDFSRENSEIVTGKEYLQGLLNMLSGTVPVGTKLIIRGENSVDWNRLKSEKKIVLYRVLQEVMVNMKKHSKAKLVALVFSVENKSLKISYSDNGVGADLKILQNGNGIKNLQDRLETINGKALFETAEKGVKAEFTIPLGT